MRTLTGAILILAAAVVYTGGTLCDTAFRITLEVHGGNPFFFVPDYADVLAAFIGVLGVGFLIWGAVTDRRPPTAGK
jgi:hypothetical protein